MACRLRVHVLPIRGDCGNQRRQTDQRRVNLQQLAIDNTFNDNRCILEVRVRGTQGRLPRAFEQEAGASDQGGQNQSDTERDCPAEGTSVGQILGFRETADLFRSVLCTIFNILSLNTVIEHLDASRFSSASAPAT
ncbi:hypothetical protein [Rhodopila sp.]|uniref:hypothetical protein n=1 Tax=Rhodopila sp. TaxID=2480087 RepID=UPI003D1208CE